MRRFVLSVSEKIQIYTFVLDLHFTAILSPTCHRVRDIQVQDNILNLHALKNMDLS